MTQDLPPPPPADGASPAPKWFDRPATALARQLLGCVLVRQHAEGEVRARIVECEAYRGPEDRAAHSRGGLRTPRNEAMWGEGGRAYVYFVYGMHWCLNVVARGPGHPEAVLLRGAEILSGQDLVRARRRGRGWPHAMLRGPACLTQGLAVDGSLDGHPLARTPLRLLGGAPGPEERIACSPRIGVAYAGEHAARPWRYYLAGSPGVSGPARLRR